MQNTDNQIVKTSLKEWDSNKDDLNLINPELVQQILSYEKDVEVLAPEGLRKLMGSR